jgi:transcriptional regulator with XRE-family HTH domain
MDVGERIAAWRDARGLTQQQLAEAIGVTHAAVFQWEMDGDGRTTPSLKNLQKVCKVFGITMERFYGRIPKAKARAS